MAEKVQVSLQCEEDGTEVVLGGPGEYTLGRGALMKVFGGKYLSILSRTSI